MVVDKTYIPWYRRGIFGKIRWYYRRLRYGPFNEYIFPVIKNMSSECFIDQLASVQPMVGPHDTQVISFEILDENNPKVSQIFSDGLKDPCCNGCCAPRWYKIWTGTEWIFERKVSSTEWKNIVTKFHKLK